MEVGKERVWVLEGPEMALNLVEFSPTVPDCFELFRGIESSREWRAGVDRALGSRVRSLEGRWVTVSIVAKGRAWSGSEPRRSSQPTTHDWITSVYRPINDFTRLSTSTQRPLTTYPDLSRPTRDQVTTYHDLTRPTLPSLRMPAYGCMYILGIYWGPSLCFPTDIFSYKFYKYLFIW